MKEDQKDLSCAAFQAQLPDLETIAEAARQLFPVVEPPDALWAQIESKIKEESTVGAEHQEPNRSGGPASAHKPN